MVGLVDSGGCLKANWRGKFARCAVLHELQTSWPGLRELWVVVIGIKGKKGKRGPSGFFGRRSGRRAAKRLSKVVLWVGLTYGQGGRFGLCGFGTGARAVPIIRGQAVATGDGVACHLFHHVTAAHVWTQGQHDRGVRRGRWRERAVDLHRSGEGVTTRRVLADEEHIAQQGRYFDAVANARPALAVGAACSHERLRLVLLGGLVGGLAVGLAAGRAVAFATLPDDSLAVRVGVDGAAATDAVVIFVRAAIQASTSDSRQATAWSVTFTAEGKVPSAIAA